MNLIFITLSNINGIREQGIYADLMRKFRDEGHNIYIVSAAERRWGMKTQVIEVDGVQENGGTGTCFTNNWSQQ